MFFVVSITIGIVVDIKSEKFENKKIVNFNKDYEFSEKITRASKKINSLILHAHYLYSDSHKDERPSHVGRYLEDYKKLKADLDESIGVRAAYDPEITAIRDRIVEIHKHQMEEQQECYEDSILMAIKLGNLSQSVELDTKNNVLRQEKRLRTVNIGYIVFVIAAYMCLVFIFIVFNKIVFVDPLRALIDSIFQLSKSNTRQPIPFLDQQDEIGMLAVAIRTIQGKINSLGIDSLTKVNSRFFLEENLSKLERFYLIYFDVDQFKSINDRLGHHYGDAVLCEIVEIFCKALGRRDTVYRIGGDEFLVVVAGPLDAVHNLIGTVFETLARPVMILGRPIEISISAGVQYCTTGSAILRDIDAADRGMYQSKKTPGNACTYMVDPDDTSGPSGLPET